MLNIRVGHETGLFTCDNVRYLRSLYSSNGVDGSTHKSLCTHNAYDKCPHYNMRGYCARPQASNVDARCIRPGRRRRRIYALYVWYLAACCEAWSYWCIKKMSRISHLNNYIETFSWHYMRHAQHHQAVCDAAAQQRKRCGWRSRRRRRSRSSPNIRICVCKGVRGSCMKMFQWNNNIMRFESDLYSGMIPSDSRMYARIMCWCWCAWDYTCLAV